VAIARKAKKLLSIARHPEYRKGLRFAVAPAIEHHSMLQSLPQLASIVDVGANRGQFVLVARRVHPAANITAFEPLSNAGSSFSRLFRDDPNVVLHPVAIGALSADAELHVSSSDDSSSLLPITDLQEATFPGTKERSVERVSVKRLSEVLDPSQLSGPAFLKIDVQGGELDVLRGAEGVLELFEYVCVEVSFVELYAGQPLAHQVLSYLGRSGFTLSGVYNPVADRQGRSVQADFLFRRSP
jgi:FkbM family methyltransferase